MTDVESTCQSMTEVCDVILYLLMFFFDWVHVGAGITGDFKNPVGGCSQFVYSGALRLDKYHLHLSEKPRQEELFNTGPLTNDLSHS